MAVQLRSRQRGLSFLGLLVVGGFLAVAGVITAQVIPTAMEYQAVVKAVKKASEGNTVAEVRSIFDKASAIDDFTSVKPADLQISKKGDKVVVAFADNKEIEIFAPVFLLIKYSGSTE